MKKRATHKTGADQPSGSVDQEEKESLKREIDRLKKNEEALRKKSDFLATILETISNPVFYKDTKGEYTGCNKAFEDYIGLSRSDIVGKTVFDLSPKDIATKYHEKDVELFAQSGKQRYEWKVQRYDGAVRDVIFDKAAIADANGEVIGLVGVISDITERKRAEKALKENEKTLTAILAASPVGIFLVHRRILGWANQAMYRICGYAEDTLLGKSTRVLYPDDDEYERVGREFYTEIDKLGIARIESRWVTRKNEQIHCYLQGCPLDPNDPSKGVIVVALDITERKRIEQEIRQLKEKYEDLYHNSPTMNVSLDPQGIIVECNNTILEKLGYPRNAFVGQPITAFLTEDAAAKMKQDFPELHEKGSILGADRQLITKSGNIIDVIVSVTMEYDEKARPKMTRAVFKDISKRKRAEDLVHDLSQRLMQAQEHERKMIAYELHDCIAQNLSLLKINCDTIHNSMPTLSNEIKGKMERHSRLIEQTIQTVRDLSYGLSPPGLDEVGIVQTLAKYCEEFEDKSRLHVAFAPVNMDGVEPDQNTAINFFRIVQEGLTNAWKHADANTISVALIAEDSHLLLQINDNGHGFDEESRECAELGERRMGLRIIKERVSLLKGEIEIHSHPLQGTQISVKCPLEKRKPPRITHHEPNCIQLQERRH